MTDTTPDAERTALAALLNEDVYVGDDIKQPEQDSGYGFVAVARKGEGGRRWTETMHTTIKSTVSGRFWQYEWERGLTENQENEYPDFDEPTTLVEVEPYTKTITVTRYKRKAA